MRSCAACGCAKTGSGVGISKCEQCQLKGKQCLYTINEMPPGVVWGGFQPSNSDQVVRPGLGFSGWEDCQPSKALTRLSEEESIREIAASTTTYNVQSRTISCVYSTGIHVAMEAHVIELGHPRSRSHSGAKQVTCPILIWSRISFYERWCAYDEDCLVWEERADDGRGRWVWKCGNSPQI